MAVNVKMGVELGGFNSAIDQGKNILKGLKAEMKATEAEFKATGNAEQAMEKRTKTLNAQLQTQKNIANQAQAALKAMEEAGVKPTDAAYQKMYATMMNATAGMNEAQAALNGLGQSAGQAATNADALSSSVNSIGKKISLDQVISGIDRITTGLENAAKRAVQLGQDIWNAMMQSAQLADDIGTQAAMFDMTPERYQQYKGVFDTIGEITISEWASAKRKIENAMVGPSSQQIDILKALGFAKTTSQGYGQFEEVLNLADNWEDVFWQVGTELRKRVENGELSAEMADVYGEALFGKKFSSMKNLLGMGKEAFEAALGNQVTASDEAIKKDAELNDAVIKLQSSFEALKMEVLSGLAPSLTSAVGTIDSFLSTIMEYLQSPEGQEALTKLGDAVSGLFEDLGNIDPASVVENFTNVFNTLVSSLQWIVDNKDTLVGALESVVVGWGALQLTGGVLQILKLIDGLRSLGVLGGGGGAVAGGGGAGWLTGVSTAVSGMLPGIATWVSANGGPVMDWLTHESPIASLLRGEENVSQMWSRWENKFQGNAETFSEDWSNNKITQFFASGIETIRQNLQNTVDYYTGIHDTLTNADAWNFGDMSLDEIMAQINGGEPVEVPADLDVETKPSDISEQVGTVAVQGQLVINGYTFGWGAGGGGTGGAGVNVLRKYANGLPFVPYDGLAMLHKGERVVPAREVASRNFSSNLYVENMNMNGGVSADALAAAIAGRNRRMMAGYGS